jgi:hypothetical protein
MNFKDALRLLLFVDYWVNSRIQNLNHGPETIVNSLIADFVMKTNILQPSNYQRIDEKNTKIFFSSKESLNDFELNLLYINEQIRDRFEICDWDISFQDEILCKQVRQRYLQEIEAFFANPNSKEIRIPKNHNVDDPFTDPPSREGEDRLMYIIYNAENGSFMIDE